jgi:hypothetical protein
MKMEEFESFDFWKEGEPMTEREKVDKTRKLSKTLCVPDDPSTCPSQTNSNKSLSRISVVRSSAKSGARSEKNLTNEEIFKGNSTVIER